VHGPNEFRNRLGKGAKSLAKRSVHALFDSGSKWTSSISTGLAKLTFDDDYKRQHYIESLQNPRSVGDGLMKGAKEFGKGFLEGFSGIVVQPLKGAKAEGTIGFVKGVGKGLIGVPVRPIAGIVDFAAKTMGGIAETVMDTQQNRIRFPRTFENGVLVPYSQESAYGQYVLSSLKNGKFSLEKYRYLFVHKKVLYIFSENRIFCVKCRNGNDYSLKWSLSYQDIAGIEKKESAIVLKREKSISSQSCTSSSEETKKKWKAQQTKKLSDMLIQRSKTSFSIKLDSITLQIVYGIIQELSTNWHEVQQEKTKLNRVQIPLYE